MMKPHAILCGVFMKIEVGKIEQWSVSNKRIIRVRSLTDSTELHLTLDGQISFDLMAGDVVAVTKSKKSVKFIRSPFRDYFSILKTKLMWGERYGSI